MSARRQNLLFILIALAAMPLEAAAQSANMFAPERVGRWYLSGGLGGFAEESNPQLANQDGDFGLTISGGYRLSPYVALEADALLTHQDFDTPATIPAPFLGTVDSRADLYTNGIGVLVKFILPLNRLELYAGAGLGAYVTTLRVEGTVLGVPAELEDDDTDVGYQVLAGADLFVSRYVSVGLEYRRFKLDANFGALVPGKLDVGGDLFLATVRGHF
jgi:opacity protein-like surface antigen